MRFKIDGVPYDVPNYTPIGVYSKIYKIKDLFTEDYFAAKLINAVSSAPLQDLLDCPYEEISYIASYILKQLPNKDEVKFKDRFELDGVHYGFFSNWKDLTFAEFIDMDTISTKKPEELLNMLHILASIMYRPIVNERSEHDFDIEKYDVNSIPKRSELFKNKLDVGVILGAQFFFIKFVKKYSNYTPPSLTTNLSRWQKIKLIWTLWRMIYRIPSNKRSDGFWSSTKLLTTILLNTSTSTGKK
jgi:hypothetical protein